MLKSPPESIMLGLSPYAEWFGLQITRSTAHIEASITQQGKLLFKASGSFAIRPNRVNGGSTDSA